MKTATLALCLASCTAIAHAPDVDEMSDEQFSDYVAASVAEVQDWVDFAAALVSDGKLSEEALPALASLMRLSAQGEVPLADILEELAADDQDPYVVAGLKILLRRLNRELPPVGPRAAAVLTAIADVLDPPEVE